MQRRTALDRAIENLQGEKAVLELALAKLMQQQAEQKRKNPSKPRRLVGAPVERVG